jgi:enoyl-CoA hydratase/carnithine racemase
MRVETTAVAREPFVLTARAGEIAALTLNRSERFNPLSMAMIAALQAELNAIADDRSVRVVVLAARGKSHGLRDAETAEAQR